ncbi:MAG: hypothetical protein HQK54_09810 [Oligoflexales bacterium]|nr:hypothetical protein [Oligoflexales bacterium]
MLPRFLIDKRFFLLLLKFDKDLAEQLKANGCSCCEDANPLHQANFQRQPRGFDDKLSEDKDFNRRFSFCCYKKRTRHTPPSFRFLGRKVYLGAIIILVSAMIGGACPKRRQKLREIIGADSRTLARWRQWWMETFTQTHVWKALSARLALAKLQPFSLPLDILLGINLPSLEDSLLWLLSALLPLTGGVKSRLTVIFGGHKFRAELASLLSMVVPAILIR